MLCVTPPLIEAQAVLVALPCASLRVVPEAMAQFVWPPKVIHTSQVCCRNCRLDSTSTATTTHGDDDAEFVLLCHGYAAVLLAGYNSSATVFGSSPLTPMFRRRSTRCVGAGARPGERQAVDRSHRCGSSTLPTGR